MNNKTLEEKFIKEDPECDIVEGRYKPKTAEDVVDQTRKDNPLIMADFPRKGSAKGIMNWVLNGDVNDSSIRLNNQDGF